MRSVRKNILGFCTLVVDVIIVYISYFLLVYIRKLLGIPFSSENLLALRIFLPYAIVIFVLLFVLYKLYEVEVVDFYETFLGILFTSLIMFVLGFALPFFLRVFAVPRSVILFALPVQLVILSVAHLLVRKIYFSILPPLDVLILTGDPDEGRVISEYFKRYFPKVQNADVFASECNNFQSLLEEKLDSFDLFVIGDNYNPDEKSKFIEFLTAKDKTVYIVTGAYGLLLLNQNVRILGDLPFFEINLLDISPLEKVLKRLIDLIVSIVALAVFSPVILVISIAILRETGRPIFYLQDRVGLNGKIFKIVKFRTMIQDAEKYTGAVLSKEDDPRVTKVGKFLRKTGLDEIPQFVNVLRGEMSVVGPRPERPELVEKIQKDVPNFEMRLKVKPGITGYAQLYGKYDTSFDYKLKMDLLYARSRNIILTDIYIIINTVKLFLTPKKRK